MAYSKKWSETERRQKWAAKARKWRLQHPERVAAPVSEDQRQKRNAAARQRRLEHPERFRDAQKKHRALHPRDCQWVQLNSSARKRGIEVGITFEFFCGLREMNQCHYCGQPLPTLGSGIDRKNPALGYVVGNCIPCCHLHNKMKWVMDYDTFLAECRAIAKRFES